MMAHGMKRAVAAMVMASGMLGLPTVAWLPGAAVATAAEVQPAVQAQQGVDKALDFLRSKQQRDGGWQQGTQPPAITAVVLKAMVQDAKYDAKTDFVKKGYDKLLTYQLENGGIYRDLLANYNTAIAVSSLAAAENPAFKDRIDKAVAYLKSLQWNYRSQGGPKGEGHIDVGSPWFGGAGYGSKGRPDGSNTQLMLDALHDAGLPSNDPAFQ